ncbi:DUF2642 domain-containing protein [Neobacillus sp. OS1-32]|uniref:DUF2642 domain-containing protein n=1 Tax=Neobacillus sp. OS1-32 TaxID=3070682 RepID=UPI0027DFEEF9|nr:DUF2642 domain-containing protein [Neobacillus sp. OS1-32]WML31373.1 DUF2642 domain-containing protein [Neobacillus sp. OS1-32]
MMSEKTFHQVAGELLHHEVIVITRQGNFEGKLLSVGNDVIVLESRQMGGRPVKLFIRIEEVVAIYRAERRPPMGPFGFMPMGEEFEESSEKHEIHESN